MDQSVPDPAAPDLAGVLRGLAENPALPADLRADLAARRPDLAADQPQAGPPDLTAADLVALATDPSPTNRWTAAEHPDLPADLHRRLARDPVPGVRAALARNPALAEPLIREMAVDRTHDVQRSLAHNPAVPLDVLADLAAATPIGPTLLPRVAAADPDELRGLAAAPDPAVRVFVAERPDLPGDVVRALAVDPDLKVLKSIARHPAVPAERLRALLDEHGARIAASVARNPACPPDLLDRLLELDVPKVRRALAGHPALPTSRLLALLHDPDWGTARAAAANPALPRSAMAALLAGLPAFPDFARAPNIAGHPDVYERENEAIDPSGALWTALRAEADWAGRTLLDLGCGTGFWLPRYADAARVVGVEPDPDLRARAVARGGGEVLAGSAEHIPLPDASVDVVHARFAYFFPPDCEPGLREVLRVLAPGGALVVIDNDWRAGEFAGLLTASAWATAQGAGETTDAWWAGFAARRTPVMSAWRCRDAAELDAVLRIEFPAHLVDAWVREHPDRREISCGYVLFTVRRPPR